MIKTFLHSKGFIAKWNDSTQTYWFSKGEEEFEIPADLVEGSNDWVDKTGKIADLIGKGTYLRCISDDAVNSTGRHIVEKGRIVQVLSLEKNESFYTLSPANRELMQEAYPNTPTPFNSSYKGTGHHFLKDYEIVTEEDYFDQLREQQRNNKNNIDVPAFDEGDNYSYKIISFSSANGHDIYTYNGNTWIRENSHDKVGIGTKAMLGYLKTAQINIHSIIRKSDNQLFKVGDMIHSVSWRKDSDQDTIAKITPSKYEFFLTRQKWNADLEGTIKIEADEFTVKKTPRRDAIVAIEPGFVNVPPPDPVWGVLEEMVNEAVDGPRDNEPIDIEVPIVEREEFIVKTIIGTDAGMFAGKKYFVRNYEKLHLPNIMMTEMNVESPDFNVDRFMPISRDFINSNFVVYEVVRVRDGSLFCVGDRVYFPAGNVITIKTLEVPLDPGVRSRNMILANNHMVLNRATRVTTQFITDDHESVVVPIGAGVYTVDTNLDNVDVRSADNNLSRMFVRNNQVKEEGFLYFADIHNANRKIEQLINEKNRNQQR